MHIKNVQFCVHLPLPYVRSSTMSLSVSIPSTWKRTGTPWGGLGRGLVEFPVILPFRYGSRPSLIQCLKNNKRENEWTNVSWKRSGRIFSKITWVHMVLVLVFLVVGRPLFPTTKSFMGCPLTHSFTLYSLFFVVQATTLPWALVFEGIRRGGSRDAIGWLRMRLYGACVGPGMQANPSTCWCIGSHRWIGTQPGPWGSPCYQMQRSHAQAGCCADCRPSGCEERQPTAWGTMN